MRSAPFAMALLVGVLGAACVGDDGGQASAEPSNAAAAASTCATLVSWTNDVAEIVNATEAEMQEGADLPALMLDAVDQVIVRTDRLGDEIADLSFPDTPGGRSLAEDVRSGQVAAAEDIDGFRAEIEAIPDPDPESRNFRKAQLVVELEKPRSLVKPDVQGDLGDVDLEAVIAAEDSCRHVTRSQ